MGRAKQRSTDDEFSQVEAKAERRARRQADAEEKRARTSKSQGLQSQGEVGIVEPDRPLTVNPRGRRAAPTRFDAMPIAGHERLPGYDTPVTTRDEGMRYPRPETDRPARISTPPGAGPDAMKIDAEQQHDLQQSSEEAVNDAADDAAENAFDDASFDEHVSSTDLPRRSRSDDADEDEDKIF